jgi:hypothetical protein
LYSNFICNHYFSPEHWFRPFLRAFFVFFFFSFCVPLLGISKEYLESAYYGPAASPHMKKHRGEETKTRRHCGVWFGCPLRCALTLYRRHSQMIPKSRPAQPDPCRLQATQAGPQYSGNRLSRILNLGEVKFFISLRRFFLTSE